MGYDKGKFMETQKIPRKLKKKLKGVRDAAGVPVVKKESGPPSVVAT